jgi:outer membrane protein TolC
MNYLKQEDAMNRLIATVLVVSLIFLSVPVRGAAALQEPNSREAAKAKIRKLQQERVILLQKAVEVALAQYREGRQDFRTVKFAQQELLKAKLEMAETHEEQIQLLTSQLKVAKGSLAIAEAMYQAGQTTELDVLQARSAVIHIEIRLLKLRVSDKLKQPQ